MSPAVLFFVWKKKLFWKHYLIPWVEKSSSASLVTKISQDISAIEMYFANGRGWEGILDSLWNILLKVTQSNLKDVTTFWNLQVIFLFWIRNCYFIDFQNQTYCQNSCSFSSTEWSFLLINNFLNFCCSQFDAVGLICKWIVSSKHLYPSFPNILFCKYDLYI